MSEQATSSPRIESKMILGLKVDKKRLAALTKAKVLPKGAAPTMCVFECKVGASIRYCCWAGGKIVDPPDNDGRPPLPALTPVGQLAVECMMAMPFIRPRENILIFAELRLGKTPLQDKVIDIFVKSPDRALICFFGDLAVELDGKMSPTFNFNGFVEAKDCVGTLPASAASH